MGANEQSPEGPDDRAAARPRVGVLRAFWRLLTPRPRFRPLSTQAARRIADEWRLAKHHIQRLEATTPSLDAATPHLDKLCAALEAEITHLRAPPPRAATRPAGPREAAASLRRAWQQIREAEEVLDGIAERSRKAGANADEWERCAMLAVAAGSDELALDALARKAEMATLHGRLQREVDTGRAVLAEMRAALDRIAPASDDEAKR